MAVIKTANTLWLAEDLSQMLAGQLLMDDIPGFDELVTMLGAIRNGEELQAASLGQLVWRDERVNSDEYMSFSGTDELTLSGQSLTDASKAQVTAAKLASESEGRYGMGSDQWTWLDSDSATLKIAPFNPYQDQGFRLLSGSNKWFSQGGDSAGFAWTEQGTFSFSGDQRFGDNGLEGGVRKLAQSVTYAQRGGYDDWTGLYDPTYQESGKEVFSLSSKGGFSLSLPKFDSISYSDKGTHSRAGQTFKIDESYKSSGSLDLSAALEAQSLDDLIDILLAGDDKITASGTVGGEPSFLWGGAGNDTITGGNGSDHLEGGAGADKLKGGKGYDLFSYSQASDSTLNAADTILDFKAGEDSLRFDFLDSSTSVQLLTGKASYADIQTQAAAAFAAGSSVVVGSDGKQAYVLVDSDANWQADMLIKLAGIKSIGQVTVDDFIFGVA